jgi:hypothetical protein
MGLGGFGEAVVPSIGSVTRGSVRPDCLYGKKNGVKGMNIESTRAKNHPAATRTLLRMTFARQNGNGFVSVLRKRAGSDRQAHAGQ